MPQDALSRYYRRMQFSCIELAIVMFMVWPGSGMDGQCFVWVNGYVITKLGLGLVETSFGSRQA